MRRPRLTVLISSIALAAGVIATVPQAPTQAQTPTASRSAPADEERLEVYEGKVTAEQVEALVATGVDRHELELAPVAGDEGLVSVEVILSTAQAKRLKNSGVTLKLKKVDGLTVTQRADARAAEGYEVWQTYAGPGGIQAELQRVAAAYPGYTKLVSIGKTVKGQDINAVKVTRGARTVRDGARPAVLYFSAQHAREWITPEMTTRLLRHVLRNAKPGSTMRRLLDQNELWFVPVANPDGYDHTFTEGNRLWRKNLRDNDGDGEVSNGDGVDLNRNFPYKWGYDNEGSSPNPASDTYRGPSPASEPETKALDRLAERVGFEYLVNYHSAAELLLYSTGWQVATPGPDDAIYEALAGDDENSAIPGYDPDLSAELYTTNGDTDSGITERHGTLGFTPEMGTCISASEADPDDEWEAEDCGTGFEFPDDESLVEAEFRKNIPFAMSLLRSARDPDDPVSSLGRKADLFRADTFEVSYGSPQTVGATIKRALSNKVMRYRINNGPLRTVPARIWNGGEKYGRDNRLYYAEYRGVVTGARPGDSVRVIFGAAERGRDGRVRQVRSPGFTYEVASGVGADVLVIADEDYTGVNPTYPPGTDAPKYGAAHVQAVEDAGYTADLWDVDAQGIPHDLGVLSHYDAVLWYLGDNRITQDPEDEETETYIGPFEDMSVAEREQYLTIAVRDYLNEGGKLIHAGETVQYEGVPGFTDAVGGLYYGLNGDPEAECVIEARPNGSSEGFFDDCLIMADDFRQYWLGGYQRVSTDGPLAVDGTGSPLLGYSAEFGGAATDENPLDEAGIFLPTSEVLPPSEFPQFRSRGAAMYEVPPGGPFAPVEGERYASVLHADDSYARLTRTVDLTGATTAALQFQASWVVEEAYDFAIVEARTAGGDDWTTLPEVGGATSTDSPAECDSADAFLFESHPFLTTYLGEDCSNPDGDWNALTGDSEGWQELAYDLTEFAGSEVELSITYVTDPGTAGVGVFVDDTAVVVDGVEDPDGFEGTTSDWAPGTAPESSPEPATEWQIGGNVVPPVAATVTDDTMMLGFGLEQLGSAPQRALLVQRQLDRWFR